MAVLFKDAEGAGFDVYLVDFQKQEVAPFWGGEYGEEVPSDLENDTVDSYCTDKFSEPLGQEFLRKVSEGLIVQVDFTGKLAAMYSPEPPVAANDEIYEPKEDEVFFYRSPQGKGIAVDFLNGIWAPISMCPSGRVKSLIHYPLSVPVPNRAFSGVMEGKLVPEMIKSGYVKLEKRIEQ